MKKVNISKTDVIKLMINPYYVINIDPGLCTEHEPMVTKDIWIRANIRMIEEIGLKKWLKNLLEVLEGNYL